VAIRASSPPSLVGAGRCRPQWLLPISAASTWLARRHARARSPAAATVLPHRHPPRLVPNAQRVDDRPTLATDSTLVCPRNVPRSTRATCADGGHQILPGGGHQARTVAVTEGERSSGVLRPGSRRPNPDSGAQPAANRRPWRRAICAARPCLLRIPHRNMQREGGDRLRERAGPVWRASR